MLKPCEMSKLLIAGPKNHMGAVISELHKLKVLHIVEHVKEEDVDIGKPMENAEALSELIVRIRAISSQLRVDRKEGEGHPDIMDGCLDLDKATKELAVKVNLNYEEQKRIDKEIEKNNVMMRKLKDIKQLGISLDAFSDFKSVSCFVGFVKEPEKVKNELSKLTDIAEVFNSGENKALTAVFVDKKSAEKAIDILRSHDFSDYDISGLKELSGPVDKNIDAMAKEKAKLAKDKEKIEKSMAKLKDEWQPYLVFAESFLEDEIEKTEAPLRFAETKNAFVVKGFVPEDRIGELEKRLAEASKGKIYLMVEKPSKKDKVPVKLNNPKAVEPFEFFLNLYSLPSYREIDPTMLVFLVFPLFFGFMLGDMGYGLITLIIALILKKKMHKAAKFFDIFIVSSIATIFFGALFGEFFGEEELFGFSLPHILSRVHQIETLLYVAVIIGVLHINTGLLIGFVNEFRNHGFKAAFFEKMSWIIFQVGLFPILLSQLLFKFIVLSNMQILMFIAIALAGLYMIFKGEGIKGPIESIGIVSNTLSYARLMAIGIASVELALVVNEFTKQFFHMGGVYIIIGVLVLIIGHTINLALGLLGGFLHSLRLHYVEFFTKFFKGGAEPYKPFGFKNE